MPPSLAGRGRGSTSNWSFVISTVKFDPSRGISVSLRGGSWIHNCIISIDIRHETCWEGRGLPEKTWSRVSVSHRPHIVNKTLRKCRSCVIYLWMAEVPNSPQTTFPSELYVKVPLYRSQGQADEWRADNYSQEGIWILGL